MLNIHTIPDPQEGAKAAAGKVVEVLRSYKDKQILFLVSGGSTLPMLEGIDEHAFGPHITVVVLDERFSAENAVNNFLQLQNQPMYETMKRAGVVFITTVPDKQDDLESFAETYEKSLREWEETHPDGVMVATQGIGIDGHTVGIFPAPENREWFTKTFDATDRWVVGYDAGQKNQYPLRATTTFSFLRQLDHAVFYCYGEKKQDAVRRALALSGTLAETPGRIIQEMKAVDLFTDVSV